MSYFSETYLDDLRPQLVDFISNNSISQNVADVPLSCVNRAQKNLWMKKPWNDLAVDVEVVLTNNSYALPVGFGRVIWMYADLDGSGAAGRMVWMSMDWDGYKIRDSFAKATGHSLLLSFSYDQSSAIYMIYQKLLDDFTGSGDEYLFFPANLMLLECQKILLREKGDLKEEVAAEKAFNTEFSEFCNARQWVNSDPRASFRDSHGDLIVMQRYSLDGSVGGSIGRNSKELPYFS
jgi:hypothetical protein